jgi:hypothetical protein
MPTDTWCTHDSHHSFCQECMEGPQPLEGRAASKPTRAQAVPAVPLMTRQTPTAAEAAEAAVAAAD